MSRRRCVTALLTVLAAAPGALAQTRPAPPGSDPRAIEIAGRVMEALGGECAWNNTHLLRFTFAVERGGKAVFERTHTWDKWTGSRARMRPGSTAPTGC